MRNVDVGIARTLPELDNRNEVREVEALNLAAIAAARRAIYLENQYLASRALADALGAAGIASERFRALRPGQVWQLD